MIACSSPLHPFQISADDTQRCRREVEVIDEDPEESKMDRDFKLSSSHDVAGVGQALDGDATPRADKGDVAVQDRE